MNRAIRLLFLSFVTTFLFVAPITPSFLEFKHAVARYVKYTDTHGLQHSQRHTDENVPYKKELRYLFKNYDTISPSALLSRIRSAHQEMLKYESDVTSDVYKRYEQISSALLLICAQSFFYDAQNQILNALDEIDQLIIYWRYQQHHQTSYFFGKSPHKWIIGKSQTKEITHNVVLLERKQGELYTLLGALAGHAHGLTTCNIYYDDCYAWINELLAILPYNYENSESVTFDDIAAQLAVRMKKVDVLTQDLLRSVAFAQKPNHFMQHWIAYTAMLAAMGFIAHYHAHNPTVIPAACGVAQVEAKRLFNLLINPFDKIYKRLKIAFSFSDASHIKNDGEVPIMKDELGEFEKLSLDQLCDQIQQVGKEIESDISEELKKSNTSLREDALVILEDGIEYAHNKWVGSYTFDIKTLNADLQLVRENNDPQAVIRVRKAVTDLSKQTWNTPHGFALWMKLERGGLLLRVVEDYLNPLKKYTDIVDKKIIKLFQLIAIAAEKIGRQGADQELTLMFAALIPLISTISGTAYIYKWFTTKNYAPIRIALADVNSLLIESATKFDDYVYGKLLYLIFKLRHRAHTLKDPLAHEFLADVAKLELKQYDSDTKHNIVENMFNKYAFLGRIAA